MVFYYQCYSAAGARQCGQSTGKTTKTAAREYCNELLRLGKLVPKQKRGTVDVCSDRLPLATAGMYAVQDSGVQGSEVQGSDVQNESDNAAMKQNCVPALSPALAKVDGGVPTFAEYSKGWWNFDTCEYLKKRRGRRPISKGYAVQGDYAVRVHLIPAFGKRRIDTLSTFEIDTWLSNCTDRGYSNNTGNLAFKILKIMLGQASLAGIIANNPCASVELLKNNSRKIEILTIAEVQKIFPADWNKIWDDEIFYIINKLAACTGMRFGELLGVKGIYLFEGYINVCGQVTNSFGYTDTKSHKAREIPITKEIENDLLHLKAKNGDGYLFSFDGGVTAVSRSRVYNAFFKALERIGIDEAKRKERNISMHCWRHFFNTELLANNVTETKVRSITGHSSNSMTQHYAHLNTNQFSDVLTIQENLLHASVEKKEIAQKIIF
jgi:integrase